MTEIQFQIFTSSYLFLQNTWQLYIVIVMVINKLNLLNKVLEDCRLISYHQESHEYPSPISQVSIRGHKAHFQYHPNDHFTSCFQLKVAGYYLQSLIRSVWYSIATH